MRELLVESFVPSSIEGNICFGRFSFVIRVIFGIDIAIDFEGVISGVSKKLFQPVGPLL